MPTLILRSSMPRTSAEEPDAVVTDVLGLEEAILTLLSQ